MIGEDSGPLWDWFPWIRALQKMMEKMEGDSVSSRSPCQEHSLEVQLPFLQVVMKSFKLVPIVMEPDWTWESAQTLGRAIAEAVRGKKVLLVASTDLSHYHPYEKAVELDRIVLTHSTGLIRKD